MSRDKVSLDIFWLKDDSLTDTDNLPTPAVLAAEIIEDLETALAEFSAVEEALKSEENNQEKFETRTVGLRRTRVMG